MRSLQIQVFQHVPFEGLGAIEPWALERGHRISYTRFYAGEVPPHPSEFDWLIVMGGPMGVYDEDRFPWLKVEKAALKAVLRAEKPVLGICLGAQLLAEVLGARVFKNAEKEIGWHPIHAVGRVQEFLDSTWPWSIIPEKMTTFHWHGDTFELPKGAVHLASSAGCMQQAFAMGERVVGLQFHPEATQDRIAVLLDNCRGDITPGPFVQTEEQILGQQKYYDDNLIFLKKLLVGMEARSLG